jgi:hypothetical protein
MGMSMWGDLRFLLRFLPQMRRKGSFSTSLKREVEVCSLSIGLPVLELPDRYAFL